MNKGFPQKAQVIMNERFHRDALIALATTDGLCPSVRTVNSFYENGSFYIITYLSSNKIKQIERNPLVAVCGDWFTANGTAEIMGHILDEKNESIAKKMKNAFASWYYNGHINEADPNTCILCIHLTHGVLFSNGSKYDIDFQAY